MIWYLVLIGIMLSAFGVLTYQLTAKESNNHSDYSEQKVPFVPKPHEHFEPDHAMVQKKVLENGLTVLVYRQPVSPKVLVQIAYNVGSAIEEEGERGLAHLLEHMIFKGTQVLEEGDIDAIARRYGADYNAFTSFDMTSYYFEVNKANWKHFLPILADCMRNARFDDQHLASEVKTVIQEMRMYKDNYSHLMIDHAFSVLFPANHPYHHPILGYKEDLADISGARIKAFYEKYYHPSQAVLCIVGDVDIEEAVAEAEEIFKHIPGSTQSITRAPFPYVAQELITHNATVYKDVQHDQIGLFWRIPGLGTHTEHIVSGLEYIFGGSLASRLRKRLIDEEKIASNVNVNAEQLFAAGVFIIAIEPLSGKNTACVNIVKDELKRFIEQGASEKECYKMIKFRQRQYLQGLQQLQGFTYNWIESFFITGNEYKVFDRINDFVSVTTQELQQFAKTYLDPLYMHQVTISPLPEGKHEVWQQEQAKIEHYYALLLEHHKRTIPLGTPQYVHTMPLPSPLSFTFPKPKSRFTIAYNQLQVVTYNMAIMPLVSAALKFRKAGYFARSKEGIGVEIMMSMLLEQSAHLKKHEILENFDLEGAQYSFNGRGVSFSCGTHSFGQVLEHTLHVLTQPSFTQAALDKIKAIFIHEYQTKKDSPYEQGMAALKTAVYGKTHPYTWNFDEMIEYINSLTLEDVQDIHTRHVQPAHMVLSLAGDVDTIQNIEEIITEKTARWHTLDPYVPASYPTPTVYTPDIIHVPMLRDQVVFLYGKPSYVTVEDVEHISLLLLSNIAFHSLGSRIFILREQYGLFYTAMGGWAVDIHEEHGFDYMMLILNQENIQNADATIAHMLTQLAHEGISQEELDSARQMYLKDLIDCVGNIGAIAALFANIETLGIGYDYYDRALSFVNSLTVDSINKTAREYITPEGYTKILAGRVTAPVASQHSTQQATE